MTMIHGSRTRFAVGMSLSALAAAAGAADGSKDIGTLRGKVAAVRGTAGLQIRMSAFIEADAESDAFGVLAPDGATLADPADGGAVRFPDVVMNRDTHGAPQNETSIAVDPNNPNRVVGGANDY